MSSTAPVEPTAGWLRFERVLRRVAFGALFAIVIAAMVGLLGLRTAVHRASNDDLTLEVEYAVVSRAGLPTPFTLRIARPDGAALPDELRVSLSSDYLAMFDQNGFDPSPDSVLSDGRNVTWVFLTEGAQQWRIDLDARLQPSRHTGEDAQIVVAGDGLQTLRTVVHTRVAP